MTTQFLTKVCQLSDIPERDMRCVSLAGRNVLVANTTQGVFVADEMCTHEDARLCDGNLTDTIVKCPLHGSRFNLANGKVLDDPAVTDLVIYPVTIVDDEIFITLDTQPK
jgi:naphthalene 1,2-dioxygenase system ferredoxin subunit